MHLDYLRVNKPNIHNSIGISSFQTGLNDVFSSTSFYFKSKVIEGNHKGKNMFLNFCSLLKMYVFEVVIFFSLPSGYSINSIFQWQYVFIRFTF